MIKIDSLPLSKAYCNGGIRKAVLNGSVLYESAPQLDAPANLSVTDTTASFDEVENAESYEFFVDDVSIGTWTDGYTVTMNVDISLEETPMGSSANIYVNQTSTPDYTIQWGYFYTPEFGTQVVANGVKSLRIEATENNVIVNGTNVSQGSYIDITPTQDMQITILTHISET